MSEPRHKQLGLSDEDVLNMYTYMLRARKTDERMLLLNRAGKAPFTVSCQGQEGIQVGAGFALDRKVDYLCPYYRDLALVMVFGQTPRDAMLALLGKAEDPNSGGRQMPAHYGDRRYRILSGSSPVATQIPHATGIALAAKIEKKPIVTLASLGDGSTNQGEFHEGCNFAGVHRLPVVFLCENNRYAISVPLDKQVACENIADRAAGYGFPGVTVDGNDPLAVYEVVKQAVDRARAGEGPTLIEATVERIQPHSSDDDQLSYRSQEEVEMSKKNDTIVQFSQYLRECGLLNDAIDDELSERINAEVDEATRYAEQAADPTPDTLLKYVYEE